MLTLGKQIYVKRKKAEGNKGKKQRKKSIEDIGGTHSSDDLKELFIHPQRLAFVLFVSAIQNGEATNIETEKKRTRHPTTNLATQVNPESVAIVYLCP